MANAGNLTVGVGADSSKVASGLRQGEAAVRKFRATVEAESRATGVAADRMASKFQLKGGDAVRSVRAGVAGLALLSQAQDSAIGGFAQFAGNVATGFASGGPIGGAIALGFEGFRAIAGAIRQSREETDKLRASAAALETSRLAESAAAAVGKVRADAARGAARDAFLADQARRRFDAEDPSGASGRADEARYRATREKFGGGSEGKIAADAEREADAAERKAAANKASGEFRAEESRRQKDLADALSAELGDRERALRIGERLHTNDQNRIRDEMRIQDLIARGQTAQAARLRKLIDQEAAAALAAKQADDDPDKAAKIADTNRALDRRIELLRATSDVQRLLIEQRHEYEDLVRNGGSVDRLRIAQAIELYDLNRKQTVEAERQRVAKAAAADAGRQAALDAKNAAAAERADADRAARRQTADQYGAGYGPLAQARDQKRRNRNIERFKRHADNLAAEQRDFMGYGRVGAAQFDENGDPIGVADPFAFDLGSVSSRRKKDKPTYAFAAPGLLAPAYDPGPGGFVVGGEGKPQRDGGGIGTPAPVISGDANAPAVDNRGVEALKAAAEAARRAAERQAEASAATAGAAEQFGVAAEGLGTAAEGTNDSLGRIADAGEKMLAAVDGIAARLEDVAAKYESLADVMTTAGLLS